MYNPKEQNSVWLINGHNRGLEPREAVPLMINNGETHRNIFT